MALITAWTIDAPNGTHYQPSISADDEVPFNPVADTIGSVPMYPYQTSATVWTPTISNDGEVTLVAGTDTGQARAALVDPNGVQYIASVSDGEEVWTAPMVRGRPGGLRPL